MCFHHWTPEYIGELFVDLCDSRGLIWNYNVVVDYIKASTPKK